jgi:hypothetical protein
MRITTACAPTGPRKRSSGWRAGSLHWLRCLRRSRRAVDQSGVGPAGRRGVGCLLLNKAQARSPQTATAMLTRMKRFQRRVSALVAGSAGKLAGQQFQARAAGGGLWARGARCPPRQQVQIPSRSAATARVGPLASRGALGWLGAFFHGQSGARGLMRASWSRWAALHVCVQGVACAAGGLDIRASGYQRTPGHSLPTVSWASGDRLCAGAGHTYPVELDRRRRHGSSRGSSVARRSRKSSGLPVHLDGHMRAAVQVTQPHGLQSAAQRRARVDRTTAGQKPAPARASLSSAEEQTHGGRMGSGSSARQPAVGFGEPAQAWASSHCCSSATD